MKSFAARLAALEAAAKERGRKEIPAPWWWVAATPTDAESFTSYERRVRDWFQTFGDGTTAGPYRLDQELTNLRRWSENKSRQQEQPL